MAVLLAVLVAGAVTAAEASIPRPERWPALLEEPAAGVLATPTLEDLVAELASPATAPAPAAEASAGERFRLFEGLQLSMNWRSEPRFRLYPRPKTRVWAITLPEPVYIELALPLTASRFRLYGHPRAGIAVGGTFITADPLGYRDGPSPYAFALNSPINFSDPLGLETLREALGDGQLLAGEIPGLELTPEEVMTILESQSAYVTADPTGPQASVKNLRRAKYVLLFRNQAFRQYVDALYDFTKAMNPPHFVFETAYAMQAGYEPVKGMEVNSGQKALELITYMTVLKGSQWAGRWLSRFAPEPPVVRAPSLVGTTPRGIPEGARYAQRTFTSTFSDEGLFAGTAVDDVAAALRSGQLSPSQVPVSYIVRDGNTLILNTRSAQALEAAGIPRSQWDAVNQTGNQFFEDLLTGQLQRNRLTSAGVATVRPSGGGR